MLELLARVPPEEAIDVTALQSITIGQVIIVCTVIGTVFGAIYGGIKKLGPFFRRLGHLMDDLAGEPARPGVPARPGIMVRLELSDIRDTEILDLIRGEILPPIAQLMPNHGSHLADAIRRIDGRGGP